MGGGGVFGFTPDSVDLNDQFGSKRYIIGEPHLTRTLFHLVVVSLVDRLVLYFSLAIEVWLALRVDILRYATGLH